MRSAYWRWLLLLAFSLSSFSFVQAAPQSGGDFSSNTHPKKLPTETILVKGAWASASDCSEGGATRI